MTNGYYEYYLEVVKRHKLSREDGHRKASDGWGRMNEAQKEPYNTRASASRGGRQKLNSMGIPLEYIEKDIAQKEAERVKEHNAIEQMVDEAYERNDLPNLDIYLIATNYHCKVLGGRYLTCEVAVVPFSLAKGVQRPYHTLVDETIPTGYTSEAMKNSELHQIPIQNPPNASSDPILIMASILTVSKGKPLFCHANQELQVKSFIDQLCYYVGDDPKTVPIYTLSLLFKKMRNKLTEGEGFPQVSLADYELTKDKFNYKQGIECAFHRTTENYYNCALSYCKRWAFTVCDFCCKHAGIRLVPGKHLPSTRTEESNREPSPPRPALANVPTFQYSLPKKPEEIIKEAKWPTLSGAGGPSSSSQPPAARAPLQAEGAWGCRTVAAPPQVNNIDAEDDEEWPSPSETSSRRGRRKRGTGPRKN